MWLYVSDLDTSVTESQLYDLFNKQGEVISVRIARDLVTQRSFGYGFIYYANRENARRAFELLNLHVLNGKPLRIAYSPGGVGKIFIKNLDKAIGHHELYHVFSEVGDILSCKIAKDDSGQSKGYGFVLYDSEEGRQSAIEKLNGIVLNGKPVYVEPFCHKNEREMLLEKAKGTNLYVRNLSTSITEEDLKKIFGEFGTISSAAVMKDADGNSKCFGFVNFESADDVARAVESLNGQNIDNNNEWYVAIAQKKSDRELELKLQFENMLYIKNLDDCVGDDKLKELFSPFGIITSCKVMRGSNGISRESAFVAFSTSEEASRALLEMNDKIVFGKPLYVAHAQRKEDRRARWKVQVHPEAVNVGGNQSMRTSLYVSDLELNVTALQLFDLFNQLGQVVSVQVCGDFTTQRSHGYSYVNYSNPEAAGRALEVFNLYPLNGKPIRIRYSHRGAGNIVVKNLDEAIDHGALHDVFSSFGNILSCKVATDDSGQSKGYGFVLYDSEEAAQKAVEKFNGMVLNDKKICVGPFRKKHEREMALEKEKLTNVVEGVDKSQRLNLYIKHLDDSIGDDKLKELFSPFGTITAYKVLRDANGISRKSGFVAFSTPEEASTALVEMNGKMVVSKPLYVAYAERKKDRRVRLQAQFSQMHAVAMVPSVAPCMPIKPPCGLGLGEQIFGGQARPAITLPQGQYPCGRHAGGVPEQQGQQSVSLMQRQAQLSQMCPVAVAPLVSPCMPICSSGGHGLGQQIFHGQAPPAITPRQQQLVPGTRPGQLPIPNFFLPVVQQGQYPGSRHAGGVPVQQGQQPVPLMQEQAQFSRMHPVAVAPLVSPCMPICPSGGSGLGQQMFRGQAPPAVTPPQQQLVPGTRPGQLPIPNFFVPLVQQGQHPGGRHAGGVPVQQCQQPVPLMQQQMLPRGQIYHYPTGRGLPDVSMSGVAQGMLSIPYHIIGGMPLRDGGISQPTPIGSLAFALSNFSPADQRTMLG